MSRGSASGTKRGDSITKGQAKKPQKSLGAKLEKSASTQSKKQLEKSKHRINYYEASSRVRHSVKRSTGQSSRLGEPPNPKASTTVYESPLMKQVEKKKKEAILRAARMKKRIYSAANPNFQSESNFKRSGELNRQASEPGTKIGFNAEVLANQSTQSGDRGIPGSAWDPDVQQFNPLRKKDQKSVLLIKQANEDPKRTNQIYIQSQAVITQHEDQKETDDYIEGSNVANKENNSIRDISLDEMSSNFIDSSELIDSQSHQDQEIYFGDDDQLPPELNFEDSILRDYEFNTDDLMNADIGELMKMEIGADGGEDSAGGLEEVLDEGFEKGIKKGGRRGQKIYSANRLSGVELQYLEEESAKVPNLLRKLSFIEYIFQRRVALFDSFYCFLF